MKGPDEKGFAQMAVRLTPSNKDSLMNEDSLERQSTPQSPPISSPLQDSSISSSDTVDIQYHNSAASSTSPDQSSAAAGGVSSNTDGNHLVPPPSKLTTSSSVDSIRSTNSGDLLFPTSSKQLPEAKPSTKKQATNEQDGGFMKKSESVLLLFESFSVINFLPDVHM